MPTTLISGRPIDVNDEGFLIAYDQWDEKLGAELARLIGVTMTDEHWDRELAVNLTGPFHLCRAAVPHRLGTSGNIVNVSSVTGMEGEVYGRVTARPSTASSGSPARWPSNTAPRRCVSTSCAMAGCLPRRSPTSPRRRTRTGI